MVGTAVSPADVAPANREGVFKQRWASLLFSNAAGRPDPTDQQSQSRAELCGRFDPALCQGYLEAAETGQADAKLSALLDESGLEKIVPAIRAPTLIIQGEDDTLFPLDQADANFRAPAGHYAGHDEVGGRRP